MKMRTYIFTGILLFIAIISSLFYADNKAFNPLKDQELNTIFLSHGEIKKKCSIDNVTLSFHGELFEIYLFSIQQATLNENYPNYGSEWEKEKITSETIVSKWKNCPLDTISNKLFWSTFASDDCNQTELLESFKVALSEPDNFYSYVYFNGLEHYFLLYCTHKKELYYIRVKI